MVSSSITWAVNSVSWSDCNSFGHPYLQIISSKINLVIVLVSLFVITFASNHLVSRSIAIVIYQFLFLITLQALIRLIIILSKDYLTLIGYKDYFVVHPPVL